VSFVVVQSDTFASKKPRYAEQQELTKYNLSLMQEQRLIV